MSGTMIECKACRERVRWILWRFWHIDGWPATGGHKPVIW
jgi:hypothetical protein